MPPSSPLQHIEAAVPLDRSPCPLPAMELRVVSSKELLQKQTCVLIEHSGALYTLRATRSGKLILTK